MAPKAVRLELPAGYGRAKKTLAWEEVRARLEEAKAYWVATVRPDGRPHVVPVDGVWVDDVWYYGGATETVHQRNLETNENVVMHLQDPYQAVIVEGTVRTEPTTPEQAQRIADASYAKYPEYGENPASAYAEALGLHPTKVLAWSAFPTDATRFLFD